MFVKICGVTSADALDAAVAAGADAIGFVFSPSPRQISPRDARALAAKLPRSVLRIAVFRRPRPELVADVLKVFYADYVQTDAADFATLRLPAGCRALPVYRTGHAPGAHAAPARLLFEGAVSGSGELADWREAAALARRTELILAGGLDPDNVEAAIRAVRPWGVDVSSGVERVRGEKDAAKIARFVLRARAAAGAGGARHEQAAAGAGDPRHEQAATDRDDGGGRR